MLLSLQKETKKTTTKNNKKRTNKQINKYFLQVEFQEVLVFR